MDIQTKIKVNYYKWIRNDIYEKIYDEYVKFFNDNSSYLGDACFEFNEYQRISIELISDNNNDYIEIESYDKEEMLRINTSENEKIISPGGDSDVGLVPGNYQLKLYSNEKVYTGMYKVTPCNIDNEELTNMKSFMEQICEGITYNLYLERNGYEKNELDIMTLNLESYKYLKNNYRNIMNSINSILKNPIEKIKSEYRLSKFSKKVDDKSLRWNCSHKDRQNAGNKCFKEKRILITDDNYENIAVKFIIEKLYKLSTVFEQQYEVYWHSIRKNVSIIQDKIVTMQNELENIKFLGNVKRRKSELNIDISGQNAELKKYNEKLKKIEKEIHDISLISANFRRYMDNTWFKNISTKNIRFRTTTKLLKRYDYNYLYKIYIDIFRGNNKKKFKQTLSIKKTSVLYELYIFIIVKQVFEDMGFKWTRGWLKSQKDIYTCDLESGEAITLEKGKYKIEIIYDKFINRVRDVKGKNVCEVVSNRERRRPDILINLYINHEFVKSTVVEVKYRKKSYIYNHNIETDVMNQLIAYRELDYYDANSKNNKVSLQRVVEKIIAVFPSNKENDYYVDETYYFQFIPIKPQYNEEKPLGYRYLYNQLNEFVDESL
ncbi:hypothetical protein [Clostridium butyricum]|jgi:hypothetical protein|uniref:DUF2357 domain-containing protein n=1 Tax=Clostridium butyricum TaxID=1492 RepID=A0AAP9RD20_CLOBU|nr:hypothetical protein [Clostridium butyricum]KIU06896.1 hypothetical protein SC08_Contig83orf00714 [Clostridium butyricum]MBA8966731.1 hypothetical protein [Clostridium butyricum]MBA8972204.1 hypothetical protein [Clostridium butyricum]MBC2426778.1 hypothetical protein [Clostridium butyricum]MBZ5746201.1 hypothetical protein [Clostridium butyricum]